MIPYIRRIVFLPVLLLFLPFSSFAQEPWKNPKYGPDSISRMRCAENLSNVDQFVKINVYDYALESWQYVFVNCPQASKNIYIYGARIYKYLLDKTTDPIDKDRMLDTLMLIYEQRIRFYGEEGMVRGREALDIIKYSERYDTAYRILSRSIEIQKNRSEDAVLITFMQLSSQLFREKKISQEDYLNNFGLVNHIIDLRLKADPGNEQVKILGENIQQIFQAGETLSCEALSTYYAKGLPSNVDNVQWLRRAITVLEKSKCNQNPVYEKFLIQIMEKEPSSDIASILSKFYLSREEYQKALTFLQKACDLETDNSRKAKYFYQMAILEGGKLEQYSLAREHALKAAELQAEWGEPFILIGNLYAGSSKTCGSNEFEQKAVFWAAVDMFNRAAQVDPSLGEQVRQLVSDYSRYFPNRELAFFHGFTEGQAYKIGCWINETTRVRF